MWSLWTIARGGRWKYRIESTTEESLLSIVWCFYGTLFEFKCLLFYYYCCNIKLSFNWVNESGENEKKNISITFSLCHEFHYNNFPSPATFSFALICMLWKLKILASAYTFSFHFFAALYVLLLRELYLLSFEFFLLLKHPNGSEEEYRKHKELPLFINIYSVLNLCSEIKLFVNFQHFRGFSKGVLMVLSFTILIWMIFAIFVSYGISNLI